MEMQLLRLKSLLIICLFHYISGPNYLISFFCAGTRSCLVKVFFWSMTCLLVEFYQYVALIISNYLAGLI